MKYRGIFGLLIGFLFFTACGEVKPENEKPELAPICPEGRYRIDSTKSCEILNDDFSQE